MGNVLTLLLLFFSTSIFAKTVHYELTIKNQPVNMSGKKQVDFSLTVNGGIPAPTLEFTEGDDAEIVVRNELANSNEDVSIHWHGILLPPLEDGVPFVNTPPIYPGKSRTFKFPIRQSGTYWYHSHTMLQEQKGVFGAIVIHPKKESISADKEAVVLLSDWSDENADQIIRNLKKDGDYYLYKKGTMRSYFEALSKGKLVNQLKNEWTRMGGMDLSDVGYDAFLLNGKRESQLIDAHPGEKIRLRIINASSSTYFQVSLGGLPMKVISADGKDIVPIQANEILMGMAETYDVLFTVPEHKNYELRATAQDGTGHASAFIGMGEKVFAKDIPQPDLYATMDHSMHGMNHAAMPGVDHSTMVNMNHSHMSEMDHSHHHAEPTPMTNESEVVDTLSVDKLKALEPMNFPKNAKVHDLKLVLDGDMRRYVWHINGKTISEDRLLTVNPGEIVRITYQNDSMMHHPMHLHGHFFRVLNENGTHSPWKHTVDVPPMGSRTIEFYTDEVGQWMLHCHNLFHMDSGMGRVVRYSNFLPTAEMAEHAKHDHHLMNPWYTRGKAEVSSNHTEGSFRVSQSWNEFSARIEGTNIKGKNFDYNFKKEWDFEGDLLYRRWLNKWANLIAGGTSYGERLHGVIGFGYFLPMMIETNLLINHEGQFRLDVLRKFQWTKTIVSELEFNWRPGNQHGKHEAEFEVSLMYAPKWSWAAGLMLTNDSLGAGLEYQF
jgi:FtsP/CotA-like multicopper oxidase with cupredoxin domain